MSFLAFGILYNKMYQILYYKNILGAVTKGTLRVDLRVFSRAAQSITILESGPNSCIYSVELLPPPRL